MEYLDEQLIDELKKDFNNIYPRGYLDKEEISNVLKSFGIKPTDGLINDLMVEIDKEKKNVFEFPEFVVLLAKRMELSTLDAELDDTFKIIDNNKDNLINFSDLRAVADLNKLDFTNTELQDIVNEIGNDDVINLDSFKSTMYLE